MHTVARKEEATVTRTSIKSMQMPSGDEIKWRTNPRITVVETTAEMFRPDWKANYLADRTSILLMNCDVLA
jgi:hypothetical protein